MIPVNRRAVFACGLFFAVLASQPSAFGQALTITTFAGQTAGADDGTGVAARYELPTAVATDGSGNLYVADYGNNTIRKITADGSVTTLAGLAGVAGSSDGTRGAARFYGPGGIATDSVGNVYVSDTYNYTIRKISPAGVVTTLAGHAGSSGSADGAGDNARFYNPAGLATDANGNVYVADSVNNTIRKITPSGVVTTLAGLADNMGTADGSGSTARFDNPNGVATDSSGNVYVADTENHTIRKITPAGVVTTLAGLATIGGEVDGTGNGARFTEPQGIATDSSGNIYVADFYDTIRKVTPAGVVTTLAGVAGVIGNTDGTGSAAKFSVPFGLATDRNGNLYVADSYNNTIRRITPAGVVTTIGPRGNMGSDDGAGSAARFFFPAGLAIDKSGNVYVADYANSTIRKITPAGTVTTLAGLARTFGSADGPGTQARFYFPFGLATDSSDNVYVSDSFNSTVRKISPAGVVTTLAGMAGSDGSADGNGSSARFNDPGGLATDSSGNIYVADSGNSTIRKVTPAGTVTTFAGLAGSDGNVDGTGSAARFSSPVGVATDSSGNVYVTDTDTDTIRKITPAGVVTTLAGSGDTGSADGTGRAATFNTPTGVTVDSSGNVFVADYANQTIRKITPAGVVTTLAGLVEWIGGADGTGTAARFDFPIAIVLDGSGNLVISDSENSAIRKSSSAIGDVATIDQPAGNVGVTSLLGTSPQTATSWEWTVIRRPAGSTAILSSTTARNPTFTADVADRYEFRVIARGSLGSSITTVALDADGPDAGGPRRRTVRH